MLNSSGRKRVFLLRGIVQISLSAALFASARKVDVSEFQAKN